MSSALSTTVERGQKSRSLATVAVRIVALIVLFSVAGIVEARHLSSLSSLANSDVWWHLSSGLWMLAHRTLPHTGIFSQSASQNWIAASWLYDLKLAIYYKLLGLRVIPTFSVSFRVLLAVITFLLAGGRRGKFWAAVAVSAIAQYVLGDLPATPVYASVIFFGIELLVLRESRQGRDLKLSLWLVPLFVVWANVDPGFVYGLALLIVFVVSIELERIGGCLGGPSTEGGRVDDGRRAESGDWIHGSKARLTMVGVVVLCGVGTLITPYFYKPYGVFFSKAFSVANPHLAETYAPGFRRPQDYVLMLFVMGAFLLLGMRRSRNLFLIGVLVLATALAFHSQRDIWLVELAACAVMGEVGATERSNEGETDLRVGALGGQEFWIAAGTALLVVVVGAAILIPHSEEALLAKVGESYPVAACDYVRKNRMVQPVFSVLKWGGFMTWYLPEYPVAIDGRTDLYGGDFIVQYSRMMNADVRYTDFAPIANARTIVLPRSAVMASALSSLKEYRVVYSDNIATVLSRQ